MIARGRRLLPLLGLVASCATAPVGTTRFVDAPRPNQVLVGGVVLAPGVLDLTPGMTVIDALRLTRGLTPDAPARRVRLTRTTSGWSVTMLVNIDRIRDGREPDVPLEPGDVIEALAEPAPPPPLPPGIVDPDLLPAPTVPDVAPQQAAPQQR